MSKALCLVEINILMFPLTVNIDNATMFRSRYQIGGAWKK